MATWEPESIVARIKSGMDAAKANGRHVGRPGDDNKLAQVRKMRDSGLSVIQIADKLDISRQAVYQALAKTK